jgi:hypothetical protein
MDASWPAIPGPSLPSFNRMGPQHFLLCLGFCLLRRVPSLLLRMLRKVFERVEIPLIVVESFPEIIGGNVRKAPRHIHEIGEAGASKAHPGEV